MNAPRPNGVPRSLGLLLATALALPLVGHVLADEESTVDERARQLQRDQDMIQSLVVGGLDLAKEEDLLKRANLCNQITDGLGKEVVKAIGKKDKMRAELLGKQLQDMLETGVAVNVTKFRESLKVGPQPDSPEQKAIDRLNKKVRESFKRIEQEVDRGADREAMKMALDSVQKGTKAVDKAVTGNGNTAGNGNGNGNKKGKG